MFFHTHVYYSKKVDTSRDPLKVIGSIIPDLALTSVISWDYLHKKKNILDFNSKLNKSDFEADSLIQGIKYHNTLDYLSHIKYKNGVGFAYESITPQLTSLVAEAFKVNENRAKASSHNCIEAGVEYQVLKENPDLIQSIKDSIEAIDREKLASSLRRVYEKDEQEISGSLDRFFSFATDYDLTNIDGFVDLFVDLNKFYLKVDSDKDLTKKALELSFDITKDTYIDFLSEAYLAHDMELVDAN